MIMRALALFLFLSTPAWGQRAADEDGRAIPDREDVVTLSGGGEITVGFYLPADYDPEQTYPVIIGPGFFLRDDPAAHGWVVVRAWLGDAGLSRNDRSAVLDYIDDEINVAGGFRIIGYSAGSGITFQIAGQHNDRFSGVLMIPGHPRRDSDFDAVSDMTLRFVVGENDGYWLRESRSAHQRFTDMGADTELEIVEDGGHVLIELAGDPLFERIDRWFRNSD